MPISDDFDDDDSDWESPEADETEDQLASEVVPCPACGCDVYEDADFCPLCGQAIVPLQTSHWDGKPTWYKLLALAGILAVLFGVLMSIYWPRLAPKLPE